MVYSNEGWCLHMREVLTAPFHIGFKNFWYNNNNNFIFNIRNLFCYTEISQKIHFHVLSSTQKKKKIQILINIESVLITQIWIPKNKLFVV